MDWRHRPRQTPSARQAGTPEPKRHLVGMHRKAPPSQTVARVLPFCAEMGITRVADVTGLDRIGIPVVMVCRPNARSLAVSQGKGLDLDAARASGLMEAIELHHAEHIELPLRLGSFAQLGRSLQLADVSRLARVAGNRFTPNLEMLWIEGRDLVSDEPRWLPYECVHTNFTLPHPTGSGCFDFSSNGLASGNTFAEALCHAVCEAIERDATALWNRLEPDERSATGVDLDSVSDQHCRSVLARLRDADFDVAVWETTSDVGVPSFSCLIADRRDPAAHHGVGDATHLAPGIALLRALTEAVQVRTTYISGTRDDLEPVEFGQRERASRRHKDTRRLSQHAPARDFGAIVDRSQGDSALDLAELILRLRQAGIDEVIAVDLTKERFAIPVVRVVIPGLEAPDDHDAYVPGARARRLREARS